MNLRKKPVYLYEDEPVKRKPKPKLSWAREAATKPLPEEGSPDSTPADPPSIPLEDFPFKTRKEIAEEQKQQKKAKKAKPPKVKKEKPPKAPRQSRITKRGVLGMASIFCALLVAFVLSPLVTKMANEEMTLAVYTKYPISKGALLQASDFQTVTVPVRGLSQNAVTDIESITGKYAAVDIPAEDIMLTSKVSDRIPFPDSYLYELPQGKQAMSVRIKTFESGLSGKLIPGDIVSVYASLDNEEAKETYLAAAPLELRYVPILSVTTETGSDYNKQAAADKEEELPLTVELLVTERQAQALAGLNQNSNIHLALVCRGNPEYMEHLLEAQKQILAELEEAERAQAEEEVAEEESNTEAEEVQEVEAVE
jgi:pilus assembly protein CpaB